MSGIIPGLAGAPQAASTAGGYYQNAAQEIANQYGSPAANMFSQMAMAKLQPDFQSQINQSAAQAAAMGITGSGAGRANLGNVTAQNAATLAGSVAPFYQQGMQDYAGVIGQMPGAQNNAYQDAIQQFYQAISSGASLAAGMPPMGGSPSGGGGYDPNGNYYSNTPQNTGANIGGGGSNTPGLYG